MTTRPLRRYAIFAAFMLLAGTPLLADAHGGRGRVSFYYGYGPHFYGGPYYGYGPYYAPYPVYAVPPAVVVSPAVTQVETTVAPVAQENSPPAIRYHCNDPQGFYPEVPACPSGWSEISAVPPDLKKRPSP